MPVMEEYQELLDSPLPILPIVLVVPRRCNYRSMFPLSVSRVIIVGRILMWLVQHGYLVQPKVQQVVSTVTYAVLANRTESNH